MQRIIKLAGMEKKNFVFFLNDSQITGESMIEDICNLLNNGEIPNLFQNEEKQKIIEEISNSRVSNNVNKKKKINFINTKLFYNN